MRISRLGLDLIKKHEPLNLRTTITGDGKLSIGYGHIFKHGERLRFMNGITERDAQTILMKDLRPIEIAVNKLVQRKRELTWNQFDSIVSFAQSVGLECFEKSNLLKKVNEQEDISAAAEFHKWDYVYVDGRPVVQPHLSKRRNDEAALFLALPGGDVPKEAPALQIPWMQIAVAIEDDE